MISNQPLETAGEDFVLAAETGREVFLDPTDLDLGSELALTGFLDGTKGIL